MTARSESVVEDAALDWLTAMGWQVAHGPAIAPDMPAANRPARSRLQPLRDRSARAG